MKDVDYMSVAQDSINKIKKGVFLTVKSENGFTKKFISRASLWYTRRHERN